MTSTELPPWYALASMALTEAVLGNNDIAGKAMQQIHDQHGPEAVPGVLLAWIDTMLTYIPPPEGSSFVGLEFREVTENHFTGADEVPPAVAWAGRLIVARANDDEAQARALIDSVLSDEQWGRNVSALLSGIAIMLRQAGWADELRARGGTR